MHHSNATRGVEHVACSFESLVQSQRVLTTLTRLQKLEFVHAFGLGADGVAECSRPS